MTDKQRAAAPAFQFYPKDFMAGSPAHMEPDETHVYVWLLCLDWDRGGFVFDEKMLAFFCRLTRARFRRAWKTVSENFVERDGKLYNPRLEKERQKQQAWRDKSSEGGRLGAGKRWPQRQGGIQGAIQGATKGGKQGGNTTANTKRTHFSLQTEVGVINTPPTSDEPPRALNGALDRNQAELDDINRRRAARGEPPLTRREAFGA